ncbi:MAG: hypothetical protein IPJ88_06435 [Myxococcales bacterium]|nr:MAG: hypothetical protein IPJ88_06435 [Myxococcales bacterium]
MSVIATVIAGKIAPPAPGMSSNEFVKIESSAMYIPMTSIDTKEHVKLNLSFNQRWESLEPLNFPYP